MIQSFVFQITEEDAGKRVDEFLASRFGGLSRMRIANLVGAGACAVNRVAARAGERLRAGDVVEMAFVEGAPTSMMPEPVPLEIIYEDSHITVVVKPAGLLVHPTRDVKTGTLANALAYHLNRSFYEGLPSAARTAPHGEQHGLARPGIVHRLDRATSGLIVVARTRHALSQLSRHFRRRLVEKRYLALVRGVVGADAGEVVAPIGRDPSHSPRWRVMESGKPAQTRFQVRERFAAATLVELEPVTGRTNQLRIHCAYAGHPILGDEHYKAAGGEDVESFDLNGSSNASMSSPPAARTPSRLCLHAWRLAFHHPETNEWMEFTSPLPPEVASVVDRLRRA